MTSGPGAWVLGGWQLNGIMSIYSGHPINFGGDSAQLKAPGNNNTLNWFGPGPIQVTHGTGSGVNWFTPTKCNFDPTKGALVATQCFAQPGAEQNPVNSVPEFGNLNRNAGRGPGAWNLDASLFRNFNITERWKFQLRGEALSLANTPRWNDPSTDINSVNSARSPGPAEIARSNSAPS